LLEGEKVKTSALLKNRELKPEVEEIVKLEAEEQMMDH